MLMLPFVDSPVGKITLLVVGGGLTGLIYVVSPAISGEFTPVSRRASVIAIYGAMQAVAGVLPPAINGSVIENAATVLQGYNAGYRVTHWSRFAAASPARCCGSRRNGTAFAARHREEGGVVVAKKGLLG